MFADVPPAPTLAVKNLDRARSFYEQKLDLKPVGPPAPEISVSPPRGKALRVTFSGLRTLKTELALTVSSTRLEQ